MNKLSKDVIEKYNTHKSNAKRRNIEFLLSYDEWFDIWLASGKWDQRGITSNDYCMTRKGDTGAYAIDNVVIDTKKNNSTDILKNKPQIISMFGNSNKKTTNTYYIYDNQVFEKQDELCTYTGYSLRYINKLVSNGTIIKMKRNKPFKRYVTEYGTFNKSCEALDEVRKNEFDMTRHNLLYRYRSSNYENYYIETVTPPDTRMN